MNLSKSREFFDPSKFQDRVHIIGCGAVGSTIAEMLVRFGITRITLWDFDKVESHNIANQIYRESDIGQFKTEALELILRGININVKNDIIEMRDGWNGETLSGYVFLAVDNIDLRREIVTKNKLNVRIKAIFDTRIGLTDGQGFAAAWQKTADRENLLKSMDFSHEEAKENVRMSACNMALSVCPTVRMICACQVANFVNFVLGKELKKFISLDAFEFQLEAD